MGLDPITMSGVKVGFIREKQEPIVFEEEVITKYDLET